MQAPDTPHVAVEFLASDRLVRLTLTNPARRNAISAAMWRQLTEFAREIGQRNDVRAVLLQGSAQVFSAGADITGFETGRSGAGNAASYDDLVEYACRAVEAIPQPTLALIRGRCYGAGASLAAACDMRLAAADARFCVPAGRLGLGYDPRGIARFQRVFGHAATAALLMTAEEFGPGALGSGVIALAQDSDAEAQALGWARRIAANAPLTLRAAKLTLRALAGGDPELLGQANAASAHADASDDYKEGRAAFAERRPPEFQGR